jgi:hypothetical protein
MDNICLFLYIIAANFSLSTYKCEADIYDSTYVLVLGTTLIVYQSIYSSMFDTWNIEQIKKLICEYLLIGFACNIVTFIGRDYFSSDYEYIFYIFLFHNVIFKLPSTACKIFYCMSVTVYSINSGPLYPLSKSLMCSDEGQKTELYIYNMIIYHLFFPLIREIYTQILDIANRY